MRWAEVKAALAPISSSGGLFLRQHAHDAGPGAGGAGRRADEITAALAADGLTDALRTALSQAQVTLSTAQNALVPVLRDELAECREERGGATGQGPMARKWDAADEKKRADDAEKEAADEKARADRAEEDAAEGESAGREERGGATG